LKQKTIYRNILTQNTVFKTLLIALTISIMAGHSYAQEDTLQAKNNSWEQLTQEELLDMPLEDLMLLVKKHKLSSLEELYEKVLNPEIQTASRRQEKYFNAPISIHVITAEEIMNSGALVIPEVLRLAPGLIVRQKTNGNYDVHIRGNDNIPSGQNLFYSENSISLVMIDSRPVYNHFQGGTFWETLPISLENIERIEIAYGPSSTLYGPNAVSGLIHIITKKETIEGWKSHVQAQYGTYNSQDLQANIAFGNKKLLTRITANHQKQKRFQTDYYAFDQWMDTITRGRYIPVDSLSFFAPNTQEKFPDPSLALEKTAANVYIHYKQSEDAGISFSSGVQQSNIQSIFLDTREFSLTGRENKSMYSHLKYYYKGLNFTTSYQMGEQNLALGYPSYKFRFGDFHSTLDYLFHWKNIKIHPGLNYQNSYIDDSPSLTDNKTGVFNGKQNLSNTAMFLRLDYLLKKKIRITAAGRWEWFTVPKQDYLSYQFTASYLIDKNSNIRVVFGKANRGPFMWDYHVNYTQSNVFENITLQTHYHKNPDLKLLEMQMFEMGYRANVSKNISLDMSFFYNITSDYNLPQGILTQTSPNSYDLDVQNDNLPLQSYQMGFGFMLETFITKSVRAKFFGNLQQTNLDKVDSYYQVNDSLMVVVKNDSKIHKSTPTFVGGFSIDYYNKKRFNAHADLYYISTQNVFTYDGMKQVNAKAVLNMKFSYRFWKQHQLFLNARNLLHNNDYEFIFGDQVGSEVLLGLNFLF